MFDDVPDGCVAHIVEQLHSVQDIFNFQRTCSRFAAVGRAHQAAWLSLLRREFDIRLEAKGPLDGQELYRQANMAQMHRIRFQGCFTDGGVDEKRIRYWVDHMFSPNHWDSFCSELGQDLSCVGLLLEEQDEFDRERQALRSYIIKRCSKAVALMYGDLQAQQIPLGQPLPRTGSRAAFLKLEAWSTDALNQLFMSIFFELQVQSPLGRLLLDGVAPENLPAEQTRLQIVANMIHHSLGQKISALDGGEDAKSALLGFRSLKLMKASVLPRLVGVVERVVVSRAGEFSCPVQSGVLLMADCKISQWAKRPNCHNPEILQAFQATVAQRVCQEFDGVTTLQMICDKVREGKLPAPVAAHLTAKGGWVEFHPSSSPSFAAASTSDAAAPTLPTLRPLAWFRFSTQEEQIVLESYLEAEIAMHGRVTEFLHNHELPWWLGDTDIHQVADHWRDPVDGMRSFVACSDENDPYDPATANWRLNLRLHHRHAGNMLCVKLINQENLMREHGDDHPDPNIDVSFIAPHGRLVRLPDEVQLLY
ncbi:hypothetical protein WJX77_006809 [Trebouxia sp. C0004]